VKIFTTETMIIFTANSSLYLGKYLTNNSSGGTNSYMFIVDSDLSSRVTSYPADSTLRTCAELKKARIHGQPQNMLAFVLNRIRNAKHWNNFNKPCSTSAMN
jgi:hypothetical protein